MKKIFCLLLFILTLPPVFGQDEGPGEVKLREKLISYIQNRLGLTRAEAEQFQPVYISYYRELKQANRELKGQPPLERQQKLLNIRLRYRDQFKSIIGEKKANEVFNHERDFIKTVRTEIQERRRERLQGLADQRKNSEN